MKLATAHLLSVPVDFRIALAQILYSHHVFVQLTHDGITGAGEGVLYRAKPQQAADLLSNMVRPALQQDAAAWDRPAWRTHLAAWAAVSPAVAYAVDTARLDLEAQRRSVPLGALIGTVAHPRLPVTEQLFIDDGAAGVRQAEEIRRRNTRHLKLKIGVDPSADLASVRRVRELLGPEVELRVDANHAYSWPASAGFYRQLAGLGVRAFEEPLQVRDWAGLRALRAELRIPVILDESILTLGDLQAAIEAEAIDLLNVKLTRVGGITLAQEYIDLCLRHNVGVLIGCTEDLGIGTAAILHLASTLADCDSMEGLGPQRLGFDVVQPAWQIVDGSLTVPTGPGLGVTLEQEWLAHIPAGAQCFDLLRPSARLRLFSELSRLQQRAVNLRLRVVRRLRQGRPRERHP